MNNWQQQQLMGEKKILLRQTQTDMKPCVYIRNPVSVQLGSELSFSTHVIKENNTLSSPA